MLILVSVFCLVLPDLLLGGWLLFVLGRALIKEKSREAIMSAPAFPITVSMLFVFMLPVAFEPSPVTFGAGLAVWLFLLLLNYIDAVMNVRLAHYCMDLLLVIGLAASAFGLFDRLFIGSEVEGELRTASIFVNPNNYGYMIEIFCMIALCRFWKTHRFVYTVIFFLNAVSNLLCGCRAAWICIAAGALTVMAFAFENRKSLFISIALLLPVFFAVALLAGEGSRMSPEAILRSLDGRMRMWDNAVDWFVESPVFGHGVCSYYVLSRRGSMYDLVHAHNLPLNILMDAGVVGLAAFTVLLFTQLRRSLCRAFRSSNRFTSGLICAVMVATAIHCTVDIPVLSVSTGFTLMLVTSFGFVADRHSLPGDQLSRESLLRSARLRVPAPKTFPGSKKSPVTQTLS